MPLTEGDPGKSAEFPPLAIITGPTGSGKSECAVAVAERVGAEIVCADSRQVYGSIPVGSARPGPGLEARVPHHLYGVIEPDRALSAGAWRDMAAEAITGINSRGALPLLVGGTGMWISAILNEISLAPPADRDAMARIEKRIGEEGPGALWQELDRVDPESAERIDRNDRYRIMRALAFHETTGSPLSAHRRKGRPRYAPLVQCALDLPRTELYGRINRRTEEMFAGGLVEEVAALRARGLDPGLPSLKSIGYATVCEMIDGRIDRSRAIDIIRRDTRRYAKRQMTWLRSRTGIIRVDARDAAKAAEEIISEIRRVMGALPGRGRKT